MKKLVIPIIILITVLGLLLWPARTLLFEMFLTMQSSQESKQLVHKAVHGDFFEVTQAVDKLNRNSSKYEKDLKQIAKLFYLRSANKEKIEKADNLSKKKKKMPAGIEAERKFKLCVFILSENSHTGTLKKLRKELENSLWFGRVKSPELLDYLDTVIVKKQ